MDGISAAAIQVMLLVIFVFFFARILWGFIPKTFRQGVIYAFCHRVIVGSPGGGISVRGILKFIAICFLGLFFLSAVLSVSV